MTITLAIAIALMLALALAFVVPPLLRTPRGQTLDSTTINVELHRARLAELDTDLAAGTLSRAQYDQARQDLERELLGEVAAEPVAGDAPQRARGLALVLAGFIPLLALVLYYQLGAWESLDPNFAAAHPDMPMQGAEDGLPPVTELVKKLEERLAQEPDSQEGWVMLGRTYLYLNRYEEASNAYAKAMALTDVPSAALQVDYAEALAMAAGEDLAGAPRALLAKALKQEPENQKALWLSGMAAFQAREFAAALTHWQQLMTYTEPGSEDAQFLQEYIAQAEAGRDGKVLEPIAESAPPAATATTAPDAAAAAASSAATTGARIDISVDIDPALRERVAPDDTVFVFARAESGPPMPLAIVRTTVSALPGTFTLDDSQAMMPTMKLSSFPRVVVSARVSKSGNATPASGDLQGLSAAIETAEHSKHSLTIDQTIP